LFVGYVRVLIAALVIALQAMDSFARRRTQRPNNSVWPRMGGETEKL
jgi:hypothetical protein